jgi:splicing suppressor protein 51
MVIAVQPLPFEQSRKSPYSPNSFILLGPLPKKHFGLQNSPHFNSYHLIPHRKNIIMADVDDPQQCANCAKAGTTEHALKRCAKCKTTLYCSRDCQKSHWKTHKKVCASNAAHATINAGPSLSTSPSTGPSPTTSRAPPKGLTAAIDKPFHHLNDQTWLHNRPEKDVYKLLIDCYRLRMEDDYNLEGEADEDSIYGGAANGEKGFQRFLSLARSSRGLLPSWWSEEKSSECMRLGMRNSGWSSLASAVGKGDIVEHYGDPGMPMQMRMFGEQVYGRGPGGQPGASMMKMQMMMEGGDSGRHFSHMPLR